MKVVLTDGGRSQYFNTKTNNECVVRAIVIATGMDYLEVFNELTERQKAWANTSRSKRAKACLKKGARISKNGVYDEVWKPYLAELGFVYTATMGIGTGCKVHLKAEELPSGTIICNLSRHVVCVKDGVVHDTHDCTREGTRCVYGYWEWPNG